MYKQYFVEKQSRKLNVKIKTRLSSSNQGYDGTYSHTTATAGGVGGSRGIGLVDMDNDVNDTTSISSDIIHGNENINGNIKPSSLLLSLSDKESDYHSDGSTFYRLKSVAKYRKYKRPNLSHPFRFEPIYTLSMDKDVSINQKINSIEGLTTNHENMSNLTNMILDNNSNNTSNQISRSISPASTLHSEGVDNTDDETSSESKFSFHGDYDHDQIGLDHDANANAIKNSIQSAQLLLSSLSPPPSSSSSPSPLSSSHSKSEGDLIQYSKVFHSPQRKRRSSMSNRNEGISIPSNHSHSNHSHPNHYQKHHHYNTTSETKKIINLFTFYAWINLESRSSYSFHVLSVIVIVGILSLMTIILPNQFIGSLSPTLSLSLSNINQNDNYNESILSKIFLYKKRVEIHSSLNHHPTDKHHFIFIRRNLFRHPLTIKKNRSCICNLARKYNSSNSDNNHHITTPEELFHDMEKDLMHENSKQFIYSKEFYLGSIKISNACSFSTSFSNHEDAKDVDDPLSTQCYYYWPLDKSI